MIPLFIGLAILLLGVEAWAFMITMGMVHAELLAMVQPISYWVACQFILVSLPVQAFGLLTNLKD
jgi:hypothetical protein